MSAWADYFREKGLLVVENDKGFMSAYIQGDTCVVDNFYVAPAFRGTRVALQLTLELIRLAKERKCTNFCAEIYKADPLYSYNLRLHRHFGMEPIEDDEFRTLTARSIEAIPC